MVPLAIVEDLDRLEECGSGLMACREPGSMLDLGFERAEEALHGSIVEAMALSAPTSIFLGGLDAMEPE